MSNKNVSHASMLPMYGTNDWEMVAKQVQYHQRLESCMACNNGILARDSLRTRLFAMPLSRNKTSTYRTKGTSTPLLIGSLSFQAAAVSVATSTAPRDMMRISLRRTYARTSDESRVSRARLPHCRIPDFVPSMEICSRRNQYSIRDVCEGH